MEVERWQGLCFDPASRLSEAFSLCAGQINMDITKMYILPRLILYPNLSTTMRIRFPCLGGIVVPWDDSTVVA